MRESQREAFGLSRPPRPVPRPVRSRLLANMATYVGALLFGASCVPCVGMNLSAHIPERLALSNHPATAPGVVTRIEATGYEENGTRVYRHRFLFKDRDGKPRAGFSYRAGLAFPRKSIDVELPIDQRPEVTIEYVVANPEISRIQGERPGPVGLAFAGFLLLPVLAGLVILAGGLIHGYRRIRLLSNGEAVVATLVSCEGAREGNYREIPFEEYQNAQRGGPSSQFDETLIRTIPDATSFFGRIFMNLWVAGMTLILICGSLLLVFLIVLTLSGRLALRGLNPDPVVAAVYVGLALIFWAGFCGALLRSGLRSRRKRLNLRATTPPSLPTADSESDSESDDEADLVYCTFSFTPHNADEPVWAKDRLPLGPQSSPRVTALYDPERPARALLIDSLAPDIRVSPGGEWETASEHIARRRLGLATLAMIAGPGLGWSLWNWWPF